MSVMVLSKAAPSPSPALRRSGAGRGRPIGAETKAVEASVLVLEDTQSWQQARKEARLVHYATIAERPDIALEAAGRITSIANRRLRQLGGDAA